MKPVKNITHLYQCPVESKCDKNFDGKGKECIHAKPHHKGEECTASNCHGFADIPCKEIE